MEFNSSQKHFIEQLFFNGPMSRKTLALKLNLTNAAITLISNQLIKENVIYEIGEINSNKVGRKELLLSLNPDRYKIIGVDVHRSYYLLIVCDFLGNEIIKEKIENIDDLIRRINNFSYKKEDTFGVSIVLKGYQNVEKLKIDNPFFFEKIIQLKYKVTFYNNVVALSHIYYRLNPQFNNFMLIKYGPGVGSSILVNGNLLIDEKDNHSEIGQMIVDYNSYTTLEEMISFDSFFKDDCIKVDNYEKDGANKIIENQDLFNLIIKTLAITIINANKLLSLNKVVVAGYLLSNTMVLSTLKDKIKSISKDFDTNKLEVFNNYPSINEQKSILICICENFK